TPYFVPGLDLPHFRIILGLENAATRYGKSNGVGCFSSPPCNGLRLRVNIIELGLASAVPREPFIRII
ncbi:MAG: hypothetical protein O2968_17525, partial [Acidobacteria bacterium]|nr:hypothetical protein [Acidobacteriota bacterium]